MLVKAKVTHLQPKSHAYRTEGEEFEHDGPLYKHVEPVKQPKGKKPGTDEE